jgi:hypothetical protein
LVAVRGGPSQRLAPLLFRQWLFLVMLGFYVAGGYGMVSPSRSGGEQGVRDRIEATS